ncbi:hypothetical protein Geob_3744 [Geotalea daltonii FRC-32]|uniref:Uncharacterized protein n=1 Tax=Geotalea daltonii (strain DSM 22248 / JCM 15807 / FRC-32) TaxID=316067 RepID=B9M761_GEODF|nr:contractile injection system tape measure protein [Geotalea daltonii]ACM22082.1 hypothetical protein Geob_3744 [Geotalea daltonii FRC-32]
MPTSAPHRIRKQQWTVRTGTAAEAFALRKYLREQGEEILLPVLQQAFDEAAEGAHPLRIPKIEVNLKINAKGEWKELLPNLILQQVREQLRSHLLHRPRTAARGSDAGKSPGGVSDFEALLHYLETGYLPWEGSGVPQSEAAATLRASCRDRWGDLISFIGSNRLEAFQFFRLLQIVGEENIYRLATELPGGKAKRGGSVSADEALKLLLDDKEFHLSSHTQLRMGAAVLAKWAAEPGGDIIEELCAAVEGTIVPQQEAETVERCISRLRAGVSRNALPENGTPANAVNYPSSVDPTVGETAAAVTETRRHSSFYMERQGERGTNDSSRETAVPGAGTERPGSFNAGKRRESLEKEARLTREKPGTEATRNVTGSLLSAVPLEDVEDNAAKAQSVPHPQGIGTPTGAGDASAVRREKEESSLSAGEIPEVSPGGEEVFSTGTRIRADNAFKSDLFPLSVGQAGLILLHPFLPRFFDATGIATSEKVLLPSERARAAALLHFCATGSDEVYEFELALTKILLGLDPEVPLPVCEGLLAQKERDESEALLRAVVSHWMALKNTSIEGFRSAFLQRRGLLRKEEYGWRLNVERRPFDMLLEHLPWSMGIVKLPWMKIPVYVEW